MEIRIKKFNFLKLSVVVCSFLAFINFVNSATIINSLPYTISSPGEFELGGNLSTTGSGIAIETNASSLDCKGFTLSGDGGISDYGIYTGSSPNNRLNNNISNCNIRNFGFGIRLVWFYQGNLNNFTLYNNTRAFSSNYGNELNISNFLIYNNTYGFSINYFNMFITNLIMYDNIYGYGDSSNGGIRNISNSQIYDNDYGIVIYFFSNGNNFYNNSIKNNSKYNIFFNSSNVSSISYQKFYSNNIDNLSNIGSDNWLMVLSSVSFNFSGIGNTYDFGSSIPVCFDAPRNLTCDYFPNYILNNGTVIYETSQEIFPTMSANFVLITLGIILSYFVFS